MSNSGCVGRRRAHTHPDSILPKAPGAVRFGPADGTARSLANTADPAHIENRSARASPGQPALGRGGTGRDESGRNRPGKSPTPGRRRSTTGNCDSNTSPDLRPDEANGIQLARDRRAKSTRGAGQTRRHSNSCSLTLPRIAALLHMRAPTYVSPLLYHRPDDL